MPARPIAPAALALTALLAGCGPGGALVDVPVSRAAPPPSVVAATKSMLRERLRDPESARFRRIRAWRSAAGDVILCGELNARNGFGGYVGYRSFYARWRGGRLARSYLDSGSASVAAFGCRMAEEEGRIRLLASEAPGSG